MVASEQDTEQDSDLIEPKKKELFLEYGQDIIQNKQRIINATDGVFAQTSLADKMMMILKMW